MITKRFFTQEAPLYMVSSGVYGYHVYRTLTDALYAILTSVEPVDSGSIFSVSIGKSYQDSKTCLLFHYMKNCGVTISTPDDLCIDIDMEFEFDHELMSTLNNIVNQLIY